MERPERSSHPLAVDQWSRREDLHALADLTLAEYLRYLAAYGGAVLEEDGLLLFAGPHRQPNPYRNGLLRLDDRLDANEVLRRGNEFFAARKSGFAVWAREHGDGDLEAAAARAGLRELERLPELVLEGWPNHPKASDGVEIRRASDARTREDYLTIVAEAWGMGAMPRDVAAQVFFDPDSLAAPDVVAVVAYYEDVPLCAAMALVTNGVAFGCQAATIRRLKPGQRLPPRPSSGEHRGIAARSAAEVLDLAFSEFGVQLSLCQASAEGIRAWHALGYRPFTRYARYLVALPASNAAPAGQ